MKVKDRRHRRLSVADWFSLGSSNWPDAKWSKALVQILRVADSILLVHATTIAPFQIQPRDFAVLATLRISGPPYELTPTAIYRSELLSSGGLTKILYRLEKSRLISRQKSGVDRRSRLVRLTRKGKTTIERAMAANLKMQDKYLVGLSATEQANLAELLEKLLTPVEIISDETRSFSPDC